MEEMMNDRGFRQCPNCHNPNAEDNVFCYSCGFPLAAPSPAPVAAQNPAKPPETPPAPSVPAVPPARGKKRKKGPLIAITAILVSLLAFAILFVAIPAGRARRLAGRYEAAVSLMERRDYAAAEEEFLALEDYEDAARQAERCRDYQDYQDARDLMEAGDYENALSGFEALRSFEDSASLAGECRNRISYAAAAMMEEGDYGGAIAAFEELGSFADSGALLAECRNILDYAAAGEAFDAGRYYDAWEGFSALGDYRDAASRAEGCRQPYPGSGELYHSGSFSGGASLTIITDAGRSAPTYLKVYTGDDELVSRIFLNVGASATIRLPSDIYRFKAAAGEYWYGEEQMFGDEGYYQSLLFGGNEDFVYIDAASGPYELTLGGVTDGNVGSRNIDPEDF